MSVESPFSEMNTIFNHIDDPIHLSTQCPILLDLLNGNKWMFSKFPFQYFSGTFIHFEMPLQFHESRNAIHFKISGLVFVESKAGTLLF